MPFYFKSSLLASSISVMTLAVGLAFAEPVTQRVLAQTAINGAGATFPNPLYTSQGGWFNVYGRATGGAFNPPGPINPNVQFNYAAVGSSAGIKAFLTQTPPPGSPTVPRPIGFGATDAPLRQSSATPLPVVTGGPNSGPAIQVPVVAGAIALAYNPQGLDVPVTGLRLSRATYCGILNGNITNFNDQRITADNGQQISVNQPITVVRRADGSGSTFLLTNHLETICQSPINWNRGVGTSPETDNSNSPDSDPATINWPTSFLAAEGGSGVVNTVEANIGAIGYVDNSTRSTSGLPAATLRNRAGNLVAPSPDSVSVAFTNAPDLDPDPRIVTITVPDPVQATAYPIVGVTYQLYYDIYSSASVANGIRGFINDFVADPTPSSDPLLNANTIAINRGYAPLSSGLKTTVRNVVTTYVDTTPN